MQIQRSKAKPTDRIYNTLKIAVLTKQSTSKLHEETSKCNQALTRSTQAILVINQKEDYRFKKKYRFMNSASKSRRVFFSPRKLGHRKESEKQKKNKNEQSNCKCCGLLQSPVS